MKYARVHYSSAYNISVQGVDDIEIEDEDYESAVANGTLDEMLSVLWQEAVNEWMADTYVEIVDESD